MSKLNIEKFPDVQDKINQLQSKRSLIDLLKKRIELINSNQNELTEYEKNERQIIINKTLSELAKVQRLCIELEKEINAHIEFLTNLINDFDNNFKEIEKEFLNIFQNENGVLMWYENSKKATDFVEKLSNFKKMIDAIKNEKTKDEIMITQQMAYNLVMELREFFRPSFEGNKLKLI